MDIENLIIDNIAWLRRKAHLFYRNEDDADDLAGDTIEKLLRSRNRFDSSKDFKPWALIVMRNTFITQYNRRQCVPFTGMEEEFSWASPIRTDHELEFSYILSALRKCARKSIAIECVILYAKGYEYAEIAVMLDIPIGTVMSRISNGRRMLREALEE